MNSQSGFTRTKLTSLHTVGVHIIEVFVRRGLTLPPTDRYLMLQKMGNTQLCGRSGLTWT